MNNMMILVKYLRKQKEISNLSARCLSYVNTPVLIKQILEKHGENPNWETMRQEIFETDKRRINANNIDYLILSNYSNEIRRHLALNYAKYLDESGLEMNLAVRSKLLQIYANINRNEPNGAVEAEIIKLCDNLFAKYKILDASLTESVVIALSTTTRWEECLNLLYQLQITTSATGPTYDAIIQALFKHNNEDLAWKLLQEMIDKEKKPGTNCYLTYLSVISKNDCDYTKFSQKAERLFEFWSTNDIVITSLIVTRLTKLFTNYDKKVSISFINLKGECSKCKSTLPRTIFEDSDFNHLKTVFFDRVIVGKDVFRKTNPEELESFKRFVQEKKKYDVIIDGLNVAYSAGIRKPMETTSGLVASVVQHFARQNKSVLVLGRKHMWQWPHFKTIKNSARLFLTQNLSQDDPYLLYCALNSGRGTIIVSKDLMRGHLYLLKEPHLKQLFKRWLAITQHKLLNVRKDGSMTIKAPPSYIQSAQKHENIWHLPCESEIQNVKLTPQPQNHIKPETTLWLCIQL